MVGPSEQFSRLAVRHHALQSGMDVAPSNVTCIRLIASILQQAGRAFTLVSLIAARVLVRVCCLTSSRSSAQITRLQLVS